MTGPESQQIQRIRITYAKSAPLRYTSTLDVHKMWERILRRAAIPLAYSQGFHPQPRLNQANPLPLGMTGRSEMIDIWLETAIPSSEIARRLSQVLPDGIDIHTITQVDLKAPSLQSQVVAAEYLIELLQPIPDLEEKVKRLLSTSTLIRQRRGRSYDLRPLVESLKIVPAPSPGSQQLSMRLSLLPGASGRPEEVLLSMDIDPIRTHIERSALILNENV